MFIVMPILFLAITIFIFQSSLTEVNNTLFLLNCPYPIYGGYPINVNITNSDTQVEYDVVRDDTNSSSTRTITVFECDIDELAEPDAPTVSTIITEFDENIFTNTLGFLYYIGQSIVEFVLKIGHFFSLIFLFFNAPAEVTGLSFFTYINVILLAFIAIGTFMIIRG